jgi:hypothetical protein
VVCRHCRRENYSHPNKIGNNPEATGGSTSSLSRHLQKCIEYKKQRSSTQSTMIDFTIPMKANKVEDDLRTKVLKFFISGNIAFNQADNPHFQDLLRSGQGKNHQVVNRRNLREKLTELASDATEDLIVSLMENQSKISLALDCWSSRNNYAFLGNSLMFVLS